MAHEIEFTIPPTGEQMDNARLVSWLVQPGESFAAEHVLLEIETDKSIIEVPAPGAGRMVEHLFEVDARIPADAPVARLALEGDAAPDAAPAKARPEASPAPTPPSASPPAVPREPSPTMPSGQDHGRIAATPAARADLRAAGLDASSIAGTGPGNRLTLADVKKADPSGTQVAGVRAAASGTSAVATRHGRINIKAWEASGGRAATTVVLIHGLFADLQAWSSLALHLSRAGRRVVALDLPLHGGSEAAIEDFSSLVNAVEDAVDASTDGPIVLVGHSFGAAVAAQLVERPRLAVQGLVLLAPLGLGTEIQQCFVDGVLNSRTNEALGRELSKLSASGAVPSDAYLKELRTRVVARKSTLSALCETVAVNGVQQLSIRRRLDAAPCPVSIIHGRADEIIPWQHALNAPARVALHLAPQVGHMPQWDSTALTTDVIMRVSDVR